MEEIRINTLPFEEILKKSVINVWKLLDVLKFHFIYYKIITGKGLEFDRLREYVEGDDAHLIDWNSLARTTKPFVNVFKEERMLDVVFVLDVSTTMLLGTTKYTKNEYCSILTTSLAYVAHLAGDKVGLICFADRIKSILEPSLSIDTVLELAKILSKKETYGGNKKWEILPSIILESFGPDTYLFLISDFINWNENLFDLILKAANKFKGVFVFMVRDPIDSYLPKGLGYIYLSDPVTGEVSLVNVDKIREKFNQKAREEEEYIEQNTLANGGYFLKIHTNEDWTHKVLKFFVRLGRWK